MNEDGGARLQRGKSFPRKGTATLPKSKSFFRDGSLPLLSDAGQRNIQGEPGTLALNSEFSFVVINQQDIPLPDITLVGVAGQRPQHVTSIASVASGFPTSRDGLNGVYTFLDPDLADREENPSGVGENTFGDINKTSSGFLGAASSSSGSSSSSLSDLSSADFRPWVDESDFLPLPGDSIIAGLYANLYSGSYAKLDAFFAELNKEHLDRHSFTADLHPFILKIFTQEMSRFSWLKLCWLENLLERYLQGMLISKADVNPALPPSSSCITPRVRASGRSILLKTTRGLAKAFGVRGFLKGVDFGLRGSVHLVVLGMTAYRGWRVLSVGDTNFSELKGIFDGSDEKGIISLVAILAKRPAWQLELIAPALVVFSALYGLWSMREAVGFTSKDIKERAKQINQYLDQSVPWKRSASGLLIDGFCEFVPGFRQAFAYSPSMQKLERAARWDGRLSAEDMKQAFAPILAAARKGRKFLRIEAFKSLNKIVQSGGLADFKELIEAGQPAEVLQAIILIKATALAELQAVADGDYDGEVDPDSWALTRKIETLWLRFYANYCLWQVGHATSWWARLLFPPLEITLWYLGIMALRALVLTVLEAIRCPDRAVEIGFGYSIGADLFGLPCFNELLEQFRSVNLRDSVTELVVQMQYFNLIGLTTLQFYLMNLTGSEMVDIVRAAESRGAQLTTLYIWDHFYDEDMRILAQQYLNHSTLQAIWLGSAGGNYDSGGEQLTNQGFQYLVDILPTMRQLTYFDIGFPNVDSVGMLPLTRVINSTGRINRFYIETSAIDDVAGIPLMEALSTLPIIRMAISGNGIGDATVRAARALVQSSPVLTELWIDGDAITDEGASDFARMISNSSLDTVGLESDGITDIGVTAIADSLTSFPVRSLGMGSRSGETGMITLFNRLNQTDIWRLQVLDHVFTLNSMQALSSSLLSTIITNLSLINTYLYSETLRLLASGIATSLVNLFAIYNSDLRNLLGLLAPSLVNLQELTLSNCSLNDADLQILAFYLPSYHQMIRLNLINCDIGDGGAIALAQVLPEAGIVYLDLSNNNITNMGARALADVYSSTPLETLLLKDNEQISDEYLYEIESYRLGKYCQDKVCHEDVEWYNGSPQSQLNPSTVVGFLEFSRLEYSSPYLNSSRIAGSSPLALAKIPMQDITQIVAGSFIIGATVLGVLIYKNTSSIQSLARKTWQCGFQLWQWCKGTSTISAKQNQGMAVCSLFGSHGEPIPARAEIEVKSLSSSIRLLTH